MIRSSRRATHCDFIKLPGGPKVDESSLFGGGRANSRVKLADVENGVNCF
jgi:hypothetical protein